ncbi:MAG: RNA polymerase sigma-54 factor [Nitrospirae bacterium CG18_big_fil_WC_8_21_14_2_50_70_55]|nr:RNA polymerase factor sigma-54 [Deltaproteobacteria bacterium]OIP63870.1 MAG: RNA polymerase sigma-54 factor [Nitrospirae bacterium CG2_30_70_394]PIQ05502.1 MAG: RNA polymerase sigma-54 factor [Nitrospirae bacterium CG18_big_fil_WC_8_21_14_2_50_70_55]PIU79983.1 MAG: RNA polymerase sigma-54 factor [Nitrospirae bacterium CG06_land_8_20_14_3_00_70_43]PIW83989.1 MAG: RNA polymerase sigma-54 factor [Nitrospirae bacterium CG_4_8_14_3_um_filter_70_85]PIX83508.1 MAG: RNA polymerase sigma-54 factor 
MQLTPKLSLKLTQKLVMTPQLQQAIRLLQLSRLDLEQAIQEEMVDNPILEEEATEEATVEERVAEEAAEQSKKNDEEGGQETEIDWERYMDSAINSGFQAEAGVPAEEGERPTLESTYAVERSLADHLVWQLRVSNLPDFVKEIGPCLIACLDGDGYLRDDDDAIAALCYCARERIPEALVYLRQLDPVGVFARDLTDCLLFQADQLADPHPLLKPLIRDHLKELETRRYQEVAEVLETSVDEVVAALHQLRQLEPKPGRSFDSDAPIYVVPDVYVVRKGDQLEIRLNDEGLPRPRISPYYMEMYKQLNGRPMDSASRDFIREKLNHAIALIKSLEQRQKTIYRTTESILRFQRDFFFKGPNYLRPLILRDVAEDLGMHESTISRVTCNKYLHCERGIFELKYFFSNSIKSTHGDDLSAVYVKNRLREILAAEDPCHCLSDQALAQLLAEEGIKIARRTVAKYRDELKILPAASRRQGY